MYELNFDTTWNSVNSLLFENTAEKAFKSYITQCRWFAAKSHSIHKIKIDDSITLNWQKEIFHILILEFSYDNRTNELYVLPLGLSNSSVQHGKIAKVNFSDKQGILYDAVFSDQFRMALLEMINEKKVIQSSSGDFVSLKGKKFESIIKNNKIPSVSSISRDQQSNTTFIYNNTFFLKLYRRIQNGFNPEVEVTKYLTERTNFDKLPAFVGSIELKHLNGGIKTIALMQGYVPNQGEAWDYFLKSVRNFLLRAIKHSPYTQTEELIDSALIQKIELLAQCTANLHIALSAMQEDVTEKYWDFMHSSLKNIVDKVFKELNFANLGDLIKDDIAKLITIKDSIYERIEEIKLFNFGGKLIRTHGDLHLRQVLLTGDDFIITDFEGVPAREFEQRRQKHFAVRDVAAMIRSFHYAAFNPIVHEKVSDKAQVELLMYWMWQWYLYVSDVYLECYFKNVAGHSFISNNPEELDSLLDLYMLEKAIYELDYELNNRPSWLPVAAKGIIQIVARKIEIPKR